MLLLLLAALSPSSTCPRAQRNNSHATKARAVKRRSLTESLVLSRRSVGVWVSLSAQGQQADVCRCRSRRRLHAEEDGGDGATTKHAVNNVSRRQSRARRAPTRYVTTRDAIVTSRASEGQEEGEDSNIPCAKDSLRAVGERWARGAGRRTAQARF